jgi:hypothetical protein
MENIRGLNLVAIKLTAVQVTNLPLQHKICNTDMICSVKPVLTEDLCAAQKEDFFNNMLYARKAKHIHERQPHLLFGEDST